MKKTHEEIECPVCGGTGVVERQIPFRPSTTAATIMTSHRCMGCDGKGAIIKHTITWTSKIGEI
jgi:DnaJ-class molecular chaperone